MAEGRDQPDLRAGLAAAEPADVGHGTGQDARVLRVGCRRRGGEGAGGAVEGCVGVGAGGEVDGGGVYGQVGAAGLGETEGDAGGG